MRISVAYGLVAVGLTATVAGCGFLEREQREAWRGEAEQACLAQKLVEPTSFVRPIDEIDGPGVCGLERPFRVYAVADGAVGVDPNARLGCPLTAALNEWVRATLQPAAKARLGVEVAEIRNMASYGCRTRNNRSGAKLSEHAFGNGLDIGGFTLVDGREISVLKDWRNGPAETQAFLREAFAGACGLFKTVLGPGSDGFHENHIHLDLARHDAKGSRAYCRPKPVMPQPMEAAPPQLPEDDQLMSYAPTHVRPAAAGRDLDLTTGALGSVMPPVDEPPPGYEPDE